MVLMLKAATEGGEYELATAMGAVLERVGCQQLAQLSVIFSPAVEEDGRESRLVNEWGASFRRHRANGATVVAVAGAELLLGQTTRAC